jgi:hypothetical protein
MSIILQGSTSGSVTLQEPAVAGTTVLTLPAVSGTVITTGTTGQVIDSGALPVGSVLQVVNATYGTIVSSTTNVLIDTGLTATITPKFATSKILILISQNGASKTAATGADIGLVLQRNGTAITGISLSWGYGAANRFDDGSLSTCYLDSPATTSATTYKTQFKNSDAAGTVYLQYNGTNAVSTITLMEIAQ